MEIYSKITTSKTIESNNIILAQEVKPTGSISKKFDADKLNLLLDNLDLLLKLIPKDIISNTSI